jgi:NAD-dependent protein deacetylase/lipoamidase
MEFVALHGITMSDGKLDFPAALIDAVRKARHVVVLTGAGISAESGVPTFRDALTGLWARFQPEELATPDAFRRNPKLVWEWYAGRRALAQQVEPNAGHRALAVMEARVPHWTLVTQNVDGLHQRAGSAQVIELHGNILRVKCSTEGVIVMDWPEHETPPRCVRCGSYLRPDVVWFGEMLPAAALRTASEAARICDVFLSIGTSGVVEPAASLPYEAREHGATLIEVNPEPTPLTRHATFQLSGPAGRILPELLHAVWGSNLEP